MKALITGIEGFLGANLAQELQRQGYEVIGTSLNRTNKTSLDALGVKCRVEYGDVTDQSFIERVISSSECDTVFHLAAVSIVRIADRSPALALRTNILGTINVLETCRKLGVKCLLATSDKAYGDQGGVPYVEEMLLNPKGAYEVSKSCADHIGMLYNAIVVRCANIYGPADLNWSRMIPNALKSINQGKPPKVYGDAITQKREWLYVKDACNAYIELAKYSERGAFNVGSGEQMSPMEIAETIKEKTGYPIIDVQTKENPFYEIKEQILDCSKISTIWKAEYSIDRGLDETIKWYEDYLK